MSFLKRTGVVFHRQPVAYGEPSREKLLACLFLTRCMRRSTVSSVAVAPRPALQRVIGAQKSFDGQLPDTSLFTQEARSRSGSACSVVK